MTVQRFFEKLSYQMESEPSVTPGMLLGAIGGGLIGEGTVPHQTEIDAVRARLEGFEPVRGRYLGEVARNPPQSIQAREAREKLRMVEQAMQPDAREFRRLRGAKYLNRGAGVLGGMAAGGLLNAALNRMSRPRPLGPTEMGPDNYALPQGTGHYY